MRTISRRDSLELQHQGAQTIGFFDAVDVCDVRMIHCGQQACFGSELDASAAARHHHVGEQQIDRPAAGIEDLFERGEREEQRAYSRAVKVRGGTTVYLAGIGAPVDAQGHSLAGNFTAQTHQVFARLRETMALVGGTLDDIVTMTVFITDPRYGDEFVEIRKQYFTRGFPGSALISVYALARPAMMVEVQAVAVLDA